LAKSLGEDPQSGLAAKGLGEFLVSSSLAMTKVQWLQAEVQELQSEVQKLREAAGQDAI